MSREIHVRFRESLGAKLPRATRLVLGFQYESDARRMMVALRERMVKFGQTLHAEKTRLIELGRLRAIRPSRIRQASTGDVRLPGLHPLLWVDSGRTFRPEA